MPRGVRWPYHVHGPSWPGWEAELSHPYGAGAIAQHAHKLGLRAPRTWSPEEDRLLVLGLAEVCRRLGRPPLSVARRVEALVARARGRS